MRFTDILYRKADGVAWLTINRPEVYNAIRGVTSCGVEAEVTAEAIRGHLSAEATAAELLQALRRASDMIHQRFALYTESILP